MLDNLQFVVSIFCIAEAFPNTKFFFVHPRADICEGRSVEKVYPSTCENDLILGTRPEEDCICFRGIWISLNSKCRPKLHFGYQGCEKTNDIQALRYVGSFGLENDFLVVATIKNTAEGTVWPKVKLLRPVQKANIAGTIWVLNGRVVHVKQIYYCIQNYPFPKADIVREYRIVGFTYVKSQCFNITGNPVAPVRHFYLNDSIADHLKCEQDCPTLFNTIKIDLKSNSSEEDEADTNSTKIDLTANSSEDETDSNSIKIDLTSSSSENDETDSNSTKVDLISNLLGEDGSTKIDLAYRSTKINDTPSRKKRKSSRATSKHFPAESEELKILADDQRRDHELINTVMLRAAVKMALSSPDLEFNGLDVPASSFAVLPKLIDVTMKACGDIISKNLLKKAYNFFKVAYDIHGGDLSAVFTTNETNMMKEVLENCSTSMNTMNFKTKPICFEQIHSFEANTSNFVPIRMEKDHPDFSKHLVLEIIWNMIDLTTAFCIKQFKNSYLIYHLWEQGMEKLFTHRLRIFWQYPPGSRTIYSRLFGPNWKMQATNLEKCVQGVYIKQNKMSRLLRPLWTPGSRKRMHKYAYWRNHTLLYSLDGIQDENLLENFPMQSRRQKHRKVSRTRRIQSSSIKKFHSFTTSIEKINSFTCNKTYYCQSST